MGGGDSGAALGSEASGALAAALGSEVAPSGFSASAMLTARDSPSSAQSAAEVENSRIAGGCAPSTWATTPVTTRSFSLRETVTRRGLVATNGS